MVGVAAASIRDSAEEYVLAAARCRVRYTRAGVVACRFQKGNYSYAATNLFSCSYKIFEMKSFTFELLNID